MHTYRPHCNAWVAAFLIPTLKIDSDVFIGYATHSDENTANGVDQLASTNLCRPYRPRETGMYVVPATGLSS